jgi:NitT/TauT family transport system permease protein
VVVAARRIAEGDRPRAIRRVSSGGMSRAAAVVWARVAVVACCVLALEIACRAGMINPLTLIPPSAMAGAMFELLASGELTGDITHTFLTIATAFVSAVLVGFAAGAALHGVPRLRRTIDPLLVSYYAIPIFVFYPLLVAIFGLNNLPLIAIGFLAAVPAMLIATLLGLDRVPPVLRKAARVHRLGRIATVLHVVLPAALPNLFGGIKLALAYSFIGVIAGEFILSSGGLGYGIAYAYESFENRAMYGRMLFVLLVAIITNGVLYAWETRLNRRRGRA